MVLCPIGNNVMKDPVNFKKIDFDRENIIKWYKNPSLFEKKLPNNIANILSQLTS